MALAHDGVEDLIKADTCADIQCEIVRVKKLTKLDRILKIL